MTRTAIVTCFHGRPSVSKLFLEHCATLGLQVFAVTSNDENVPLLQAAGASFEVMPNERLGARYLAALRLALASDATHFMILGSDDLVSPEYIAAEHGDWSVPRSAIIHNTETGYSIRVENTRDSLRFGAGTVISRSILEKQARPWHPRLQQGLDAWLQKKLRAVGAEPVIISTSEPALIDLKTDLNIWSFKSMVRKGKACELPSWYPSVVLPFIPPRITIGFNTCRRPEQYRATLDAISREGVACSVCVVQDGGEPYLDTGALSCGELFTHHQAVNGGKRGYWKTNNVLWDLAQHTHPSIYIQLADDFQYQEGWLRQLLDMAPVENTMLNILPCSRGSIWGIHRREHRAHYTNAFCDGAFITSGSVMEKLRWEAREVPPEYFRESLGSGLWRQVTKRLISKNVEIRQLKRSPVSTSWDGGTSVMNPQRGAHDEGRGYYVEAKEGWGLGNFINLTPALLELYHRDGPVPVLCQVPYVRECYRESPYLRFIAEPSGHRLCGSDLICKDNSMRDYAFAFRQVIGRPWKGEMGFIDQPALTGFDMADVVLINGSGNEAAGYVESKDPGPEPYLLAMEKAQCLFVGSEGDLARNPWAKDIAVVGDIRKALSIISQAKLVIANDTGLAHAAAAMGKKVLLLRVRTQDRCMPMNAVIVNRGEHIQAVQQTLGVLYVEELV